VSLFLNCVHFVLDGEVLIDDGLEFAIIFSLGFFLVILLLACRFLLLSRKLNFICDFLRRLPVRVSQLVVLVLQSEHLVS
jgi:hypothetical protein